jgi:serine/threonine protein kinase
VISNHRTYIFHSKSIFKKLGDFGLSEQVSDYEFSLLKGFGGSLSCMAPEIQLYKPQTSLRDVWSIGVVFCEMVYGVATFWNGHDDIIEAYRRAKIQRTSSFISADTINILLRSLEMNPNLRMTR